MSATTLEVLALVQTLLMAAALPLSTIAAYGFRDTPWGAVLRPLPVIELSFIVGIAMSLLEYDTGRLLLVQALVFGVGVLGTMVASIHLARIARGGVRA